MVSKIKKSFYCLLFLFCFLFLFSGLRYAWASSDSIGEQFHSKTSLTWRSTMKDIFSAKPKKPAQYKKIPGTSRVSLPYPDLEGMVLEDALKKRRSVRNFSKEPITLKELSQLLYAAQGVTGKIYNTLLRAAPSAGALYPIEIYPVVNNVAELKPGIYHYAVKSHAIELIEAGDFRGEITSAGLQQEMFAEAGVTFILSAIFNRTRAKYGERGFRYVYMEAGHISQNIALQAVSIGLGSVPVGAFLDEKVNQLINVDGESEAAIYLQAVGKQ